MADDELAARVAELERAVARLRTELRDATVDAKAARVLASGAHRDGAEIREQLRIPLRLVDALRETQREQGEQMLDLRTEMSDLRREVRDGFSTLAVGMARITTLLTDREREDGDNG